MRQFNHVPILVLPKMKWLDSYLRDHRVSNWIDVSWFGTDLERIRGKAVIYMSEHMAFAEKPYWGELFHFRFPNYPPEIEDRYRILKRSYTMGRYSGRGNSMLEQREEDVLAAVDRGLSRREIGAFYGVSHTAVNKWVEKAKRKQEAGGQGES
jgi:hypothetical protein